MTRHIDSQVRVTAPTGSDWGRCVLLLLLAGASALAQTPPGAPPARRQANRPAAATTPAPPSYKDLKYPPLGNIQIPRIDISSLPNGMKLYLLEDHELPVINGMALVRTGNLFDPADKAGLATVTGEAMRTGGTRTRTGEQLDRQLEDMAASVESEIGETAGSVSFSALKENGDEVLAVFKDVLTSPEFRQDKIDLAKSQIDSGIARRNDDPHSIAQREFTNILYGKNTPYGWDTEYATIDRIGRDDLQKFYSRYFFPKNVMLAVWGDFDSAAMKASIDKLFADWTVEQPPVPEFPKVAAPAGGGSYLAVKKDATQAFFALGQMGGEIKDKDYPALVIMADILGGGFHSRLFERVRTKMGNAYDVSADWGANYDHPGLFEISGSTKALSTVETLRAVREEVEHMRTAEVTEAELKTAKEAALNSLVFRFDTRTKTLGRLLNYEYFGYPKDFIQQYQTALAAVTRADVLRVAKERLNPAQFTVVTVGNPEDFGSQRLEALGTVKPIDLTIPPPPSTQAAKGDASSVAQGKQLLARAQQSSGGLDKLEAVKDFTMAEDVQLDASAGNLLVKATHRWMAPGYFREDSVLPNQRIAIFTDGKTGWVASGQGSGALLGTPLKQAQGELFRLFLPLLLSDRLPDRTVNAVGPETVEIGESEGQVVQLVLDSATGLPRQMRFSAPTGQGAEVPVDNTYSDFREVGGIKVPFKISIRQGGRNYAEITVTDCRVNSGLKLEDLQKRP